MRACLSYFSFAKRNGIGFYIDLSDNPELEKCFSVPIIPFYLQNQPRTFIQRISGLVQPIDCDDIYNDILHNPSIYAICFYEIGCEMTPDLISVLDDFIILMQPSHMVKQCHQSIYDQYNISPRHYVSIHIRCGDLPMSENCDSYVDDRICIQKIKNTYLLHNMPFLFGIKKKHASSLS